MADFLLASDQCLGLTSLSEFSKGGTFSTNNHVGETTEEENFLSDTVQLVC